LYLKGLETSRWYTRVVHMVLVMARPWKHPKTGIYYFRVRVPRDLVDRVGRSIEKSTLRTKDPAEARVAFAKALAETHSRWAEIRKGVQTLTDRQIEALAGEVYLVVRERLPQDQRGWLIQQPYAFLRYGLEMALGEEPYPAGHAYADLMAWQRAEPLVGMDVAAVLSRHGLTVDDYTHRRLIVASARSVLQAIKQTLRESEGDWRPDPDIDRFPKLALPTAPSPPAAAVGVDTFWTKGSVGYAPGSKKRWRAILDRFVAFAGIDDMTRATTLHVEAWRDATLAKGKVSARSFANNDLTAIKTLFNRAVEAKLLATNPANGVTVEEARKQLGRQMRDFYDDEAVLILQKTLVPPPRRLAAYNAAARRWVPWICAYTGARVTEITQTRACDVLQVDGYWCIRITPDAGSTKTGRSRLIPLHEHLLEQGFIRFVDQHAPEKRLFASESDGAQTTAAQVTSGKLAEWIRGFVTDRDVDPNHGWRHRFETEARFHMAEMFIDAIQGHAGKTQGRKYGQFPPRMLGPLIAKMPRQPVGVPGKQASTTN